MSNHVRGRRRRCIKVFAVSAAIHADDADNSSSLARIYAVDAIQDERSRLCVTFDEMISDGWGAPNDRRYSCHVWR